VEAEQSQITALEQSLIQIARTRSTHLDILEARQQDRDHIDSAIKSFENRLQVLMIRKQTAATPAKALSAAWLGRDMPQSIADNLASTQKQIDAFDVEIKEINDKLATLTDRRGDADAECVIAQKAIDAVDKDIRDIQALINEKRRF
jgi:chromosome segregation ATPase